MLVRLTGGFQRFWSVIGYYLGPFLVGSIIHFSCSYILNTDAIFGDCLFSESALSHCLPTVMSDTVSSQLAFNFSTVTLAIQLYIRYYGSSSDQRSFSLPILECSIFIPWKL